MADTNPKWTTVIKPKTGWFDLNLHELWKYRYLIFLYVRRDFISIYKQTILGPFWFIIQPLFTTIVFTVIFGNIAKLPTDGIPSILFYLSGLLIWNYFTACLLKTSDTFYTNAGIFGKVYFPRLIIPISMCIISLFTLAIQFVLFLVFYLYFFLHGSTLAANAFAFLSPLLIIEVALLGLGLGLICSSLTTKYRDLSFVVPFGIQAWMYATPIVYPLSQVPVKWHWVFYLNPMTIIIESFRYSFLGVGTIAIWAIALSWLVTFVIFISGLIIFNHMEKTFMDTI